MYAAKSSFGSTKVPAALLETPLRTVALTLLLEVEALSSSELVAESSSYVLAVVRDGVGTVGLSLPLLPAELKRPCAAKRLRSSDTTAAFMGITADVDVFV